jgi:hypothetical protein
MQPAMQAFRLVSRLPSTPGPILALASEAYLYLVNAGSAGEGNREQRATGVGRTSIGVRLPAAVPHFLDLLLFLNFVANGLLTQ